MAARPFNSTDLERLKRQAKKLARTTGVTHTQALEELARQNGYKNLFELQQAAKSTSRSEKQTYIVRFQADSKDYMDLDDERLAEAGLARDEEFFDKVTKEYYPESPEDAWGWFLILRFIEPQTASPRQLAERVAKHFFWVPEEMWFDDRKIPHEEFLDVIPPRPKYARELSPAEKIIDGLLPALGLRLLRENEVVRSGCSNFTRKQLEVYEPWSCVDSAEFVEPHLIRFTANLYYVYENDDSMLDLDFDLTGVAKRLGKEWSLSVETANQFIRNE